MNDKLIFPNPNKANLDNKITIELISSNDYNQIQHLNKKLRRYQIGFFVLLALIIILLSFHVGTI